MIHTFENNNSVIEHEDLVNNFVDSVEMNPYLYL